ncbi:uncharacterized protein LOC113648365 isoform X2 [Tachysurus ichikawai]
MHLLMQLCQGSDKAAYYAALQVAFRPFSGQMQLVYAEVTHSARNKTDTRLTPVQYEGVEYGTMVTSNQKKEDDVQYGELVFNTPAQKKSRLPKVQEDCVYSEVQHSQ